MTVGFDIWQAIFFAAAACIVCFQVLRGWHLGFARQLFSLLALSGAYLVAVFGGELAAPLLHPLGFPEMITQIGGGVILAMFVFFGINAIGAMLFKKDCSQGSRVARIGHGLAGAMIWAGVLAIRLLGTVAEAEVRHQEAAATAPAGRRGIPEQGPAMIAGVNSVVRGLASMKQSLESGSTGAMVEYVDPVPVHVYTVLRKVARLLAEPERAELFLACPGAKIITDHPKIVALREDPVITRDLLAQNYLALLSNEHIVRAASDPEIGALDTSASGCLLASATDEIHPHNWAGGPCPAQDPEQDVLRLPSRVWRGSECAHVPGVSWAAGCASGNERGGFAPDGAHGIDAQLRHRRRLQV
jgi:hypothetical protein